MAEKETIMIDRLVWERLWIHIERLESRVSDLERIMIAKDNTIDLLNKRLVDVQQEWMDRFIKLGEA